MFKKGIIVAVFLAMAANPALFPQAVTIDTAIANAAKEISESVPKGIRIAIINIGSDSANLSDYIINELIANLVQTRLFQIVPRSTVELQAANKEFGFQMTGNVSEESQKRIGQFLGAGTIITGTVTRDSANSYRLVINAIDLESFTYQTSHRASIQNNSQMKTLAAGSGGNFYENYTVGQRLGMGALNMFFGIGSIANGHASGWVTTGVEIFGGIFLAVGLGLEPKLKIRGSASDPWVSSDDQREYDNEVFQKKMLTGFGAIVIGGAVLFGYIMPFTHHKPNNTGVASNANNFPFNVELASSNNGGINGVKMLYKMKF